MLFLPDGLIKYEYWCGNAYLGNAMQKENETAKQSAFFLPKKAAFYFDAPNDKNRSAHRRRKNFP